MFHCYLLQVFVPVLLEPSLLFPLGVELAHHLADARLEPLLEGQVVIVPGLYDCLVVGRVLYLYLSSQLVILDLALHRQGRTGRPLASLWACGLLPCWLSAGLGRSWSCYIGIVGLFFFVLLCSVDGGKLLCKVNLEDAVAQSWELPCWAL